MKCVSAGIVDLATSYARYRTGRALIAVVIGGFWSMSAATAMQLVPAERVLCALAIFNGGNALATAVAAPLGSYLASNVGWRGAFFALVPVGLIALGWQWYSLPSLAPTPRAERSNNVLGLFKSRQVTLGMLAVVIIFMRQSALFTYLRPFLNQVTGVDVSTLSLILSFVGIAGFAWTTLIGRFLKIGFYGTLVVILVNMAVIAAALMAVGASVAAAVTLLGVWGLVATAAPAGWWAWIAKKSPNDAEAGGGSTVAVVQLSIGL